jgi:hypothetical protein
MLSHIMLSGPMTSQANADRVLLEAQHDVAAGEVARQHAVKSRSSHTLVRALQERS